MLVKPKDITLDMDAMRDRHYDPDKNPRGARRQTGHTAATATGEFQPVVPVLA
jgi:hypothetical protein